MATTAVPVVAAAPKVSWLKKVGSVLGRILKLVAKDAAPVADKAAVVAEIMFPQFAVPIAAGAGLIDNIAKEALTVEVMEQAGAAAQGGPAKLEAVLGTIGPAIDQWIASRFPGANAVSKAKKANLVSAVVDMINEVDPPASLAASPAAAAGN
jgi:hypothetical protein